jgi:hypothetical protein
MRKAHMKPASMKRIARPIETAITAMRLGPGEFWVSSSSSEGEEEEEGEAEGVEEAEAVVEEVVEWSRGWMLLVGIEGS